MTDIANLGYAVFGVRDLSRWKEFAAILGLQIGREQAGLLTLRMDQYQQRLVLEQGEEDDLRAAGWELDDETQLRQYVENVRSRGLSVKEASNDQAAARCVQKLYVADDPNGFTHEFYCGLAEASVPFCSPSLRGGFQTGLLGLGHLLVRSRDYQQSLSFYQDVLGLSLSDRIREELAPGRVADVTFMHTRTGRHHSLATGVTPGNKNLNHAMIEVQSMDDVGMAYDRLVAAGFQMQAELGHHPNDRMFSFYVVTPSGFALELGWGGVVIDHKEWQPVVYDRLSDWGHKRKQPVGASS